MAKHYTSFEQWQQDYPEAADLFLRENQMQYPSAKFIRAAVGKEIKEDEPYNAIMALFDCGTPGMLLWVWASDLDDTYIDEYYEVPTEIGNQYLDQLV